MANRHKKHEMEKSLKEENDKDPKPVAAVGNPKVMAEGESTRDGFKKGGKVMGHVHGGKAKRRLDRKGGGRAGGSPFPTSAKIIHHAE